MKQKHSVLTILFPRLSSNSLPNFNEFDALKNCAKVIEYKIVITNHFVQTSVKDYTYPVIFNHLLPRWWISIYSELDGVFHSWSKHVVKYENYQFHIIIIMNIKF